MNADAANADAADDQAAPGDADPIDEPPPPSDPPSPSDRVFAGAALGLMGLLLLCVVLVLIAWSRG